MSQQIRQAIHTLMKLRGYPECRKTMFYHVFMIPRELYKHCNPGQLKTDVEDETYYLDIGHMPDNYIGSSGKNIIFSTLGSSGPCIHWENRLEELFERLKNYDAGKG